MKAPPPITPAAKGIGPRTTIAGARTTAIPTVLTSHPFLGNDVTPQNIHFAMQIFAAVMTVGGSLWGVFRFWRQQVRPRLLPYLQAFSNLDQIPLVLASIQHELKPNGGGSMRDELRRIGRDVRLHGATLRAYVDNSSDGLFESDENGVWRHTNATFNRLVERSNDEVKGWGWLSSVTDFDRDGVRDEWIDAVREKREFRKRFALVTASGSEFTVDVIAVPIRDTNNGEVLGWSGHVRRRLESGVQRAIHVDDGA